MSVKLKVDDARKSDVGKQIVRIPVDVADKLGVRTGDVIAIEGKRVTYGKVWRSSPPQIVPGTIKMDSNTRFNAQVNLDETVEITPEKTKLAISVNLQVIGSSNLSQEFHSFILKALNERIVSKGDAISINTGLGGSLQFSINSTQPIGAVIINTKTTLTINGEGNELPEEKSGINKLPISLSYEDIGGMGEAIRKIREMIELPLRFPQIFEKLGIQPPKGVLLYGPPGTGKTMLVRAIANETKSYFISLSGPEIISKFYGEAENRLREIFSTAQQNTPAIIFIDEIDSIAPKRESSSGDVEQRIVAQLLTLMDGIADRGNIVVIGATNRPNSLDEALRRGGRFDREIEIGIPDIEGREEIFNIHTRGMPLENVDFNELANKTHGFVGADIQTVVKEAALLSLRKVLPEIELDQTKDISIEFLNKLIVSMDDFNDALKGVSPSTLREVYIEKPNIQWKDIGGLDETKQLLIESIEWPIKYQGLFKKLRTKPPKGILLYGPPGTGKTMLAKAVTNEINANFISIKGPELISKWIGESEKAIREIFRKARAASPCVVFFDEIDAIAPSRRSDDRNNATNGLVSQLLTEMDGLVETKAVTVLAATNRPDAIDPALMRPGRFDKIIFVGYPTPESRKAIFEIELNEVPTEGLKLDKLVELTEGYSGAEIVNWIQTARMSAIKEFITASTSNEEDLILSWSNFQSTYEITKPSPRNSYEFKPPSLSDLSDISIA